MEVAPDTGVAAKPGHHRYVPFEFIRQICSLFWGIHDYKDPKGVYNTFFKADNIFSDNHWRFYYFWSTSINPTAPLILVHETYARTFVEKVRARFPTDTRIVPPDAQKVSASIIDFKYFPGVDPELLTNAPQDKKMYDGMKLSLQPRELDPKTAHRPALMEKLRKMVDATANVLSKLKQDKKKTAQAEHKRLTDEALKNMQLALGLRSATSMETSIPISPDCAPGFPFYQSPVIICVDVEAHEESPNIVTEIGIATLDTNDLRNLAPGELGQEWLKKIRARHMRVQEFRHHTNRKFVSGCPDHFRYGTSEFVPFANLAREVAKCFRPPFSGTDELPVQMRRLTVFRGNEPETRLIPPLKPGEVGTADGGAKRNIILLGHDTGSDVKYLRQIGYDVSNLSNIAHVADTCTLYSALTGTRNKTRLGKILDELDIDAWHLHNAGNDAWYTLAAAVGLCVGERTGRKFGDQASRVPGQSWTNVAPLPPPPQETTQASVHDETAAPVSGSGGGGGGGGDSTASTPVAEQVTSQSEQVQSSEPVEEDEEAEEDLISFDDDDVPREKSAADAATDAGEQRQRQRQQHAVPPRQEEDNAAASGRESSEGIRPTNPEWLADDDDPVTTTTTNGQPPVRAAERSPGSESAELLLERKGGMLSYLTERLDVS